MEYLTADKIRPGNIVNLHGETIIVEPSDIVAQSQRDQSGKEYFKGIPITESYLKKIEGINFSKSKFGTEFYLIEGNGYEVGFIIEHWTDVEPASEWKNHWHIKGLQRDFKVQFIHQLQNKYFGDSGKELSFKLQERHPLITALIIASAVLDNVPLYPHKRPK